VGPSLANQPPSSPLENKNQYEALSNLDANLMEEPHPEPIPHTSNEEESHSHESPSNTPSHESLIPPPCGPNYDLEGPVAQEEG